MYLQHFGLTHAPLGKDSKLLWDSGQIQKLKERFQWLLDSPGIGVLTAEPGVGKTAALRHITNSLNPHQYQVIYIAETDFSRLDFYRQLAIKFGLESRYRRTQQWRELKDRITDLMENKRILPVIIIDEAQNLPHELLRDFPSFLNFAFDSKDMMTVWLVGHPQLSTLLDRAAYTALMSRIQLRCQLHPITDREEFKSFIQHGFEEAGCHQSLLSDTGIELIRVATQCKARFVHRLLVMSLRLAASRNLSHLPDDIVKEAIESLKGNV